MIMLATQYVFTKKKWNQIQNNPAVKEVCGPKTEKATQIHLNCHY